MCYINSPLSIKMIDEEINRLTKRIEELRRRKQLFISPLPLEPTQPLPDDILPPYGYKPTDFLDSLFESRKNDDATIYYGGKYKRGILLVEGARAGKSNYFRNLFVNSEPGDNRGVLSTWLNEAEFKHFYNQNQNQNQNDDNV